MRNTPTRHTPRITAILMALVGLTHAATAAEPTKAPTIAPVVVELYTSQGCSSCPPADSYLGELAGRPDVIALSFHVDYWNRLGWMDPFATAWNTKRQYDQRARFGLPYVYTPQMVVDGAGQAVGTDRSAVEKLITARRGARHAVSMALEPLTDGHARLTIDGNPPPTARLLILGYDPSHHTNVEAGENAGRALDNVNVVRAVADLGRVDAARRALEVTLPEPAPGRRHVAILEDPAGGVIAAARLSAR